MLAATRKQRLLLAFNTLLVQYKLADWKVRFGTGEELGQTVNGECRYNSQTIVIKNRRESEREIVATMLHEIAHALTPGEGHGIVWGKKYAELLKQHGY